MFDLTNNTAILIDNKFHLVRFENGMTGIGSRRFWIDDKSFIFSAVRQSPNLTEGNHSLYLINWRNQPASQVYIFIHDDYLIDFLAEAPFWMEPKKITLSTENPNA